MPPVVGGEVRSLRLPEEVVVGLFLEDHEGGPEGPRGSGFLARLLEAWVTLGCVEDARVYLRSPLGGWEELERCPTLEDATASVAVEDGVQGPAEPAVRRLLAEPQLGEPRTARRDHDYLGYSINKGSEEYGRLVVRATTGPFTSKLPSALYRALRHHLWGLARRLRALPSVERRRATGHVQPDSGMQSQWRRLFPEIVGKSECLALALDTVRRVAPQDVTVMIQGESGVGKELFAQAVHRLSGRRRQSFVSENCAALPDTLFEAEVFGSEKGAYTGSDRTRPGLVERACGGTLFLDEIGELGLATQSKLLRVLQEREVRRVGADRALPVDFRLVTATHLNLEEEVRRGRFREDLFFRVQVVTILIPPLRERREDIPLLVEEFTRKIARSRRIPVPDVCDQAMKVLLNYDWPGNVRELQNEIEYAVTLSPDEVTPSALSSRFERPLRSYSMPRRVREELGTDLQGLERMLLGGVIRDVLEETGGNRTQAARVLGIPKANLYRRMRRYGLR